MKPYDEWLRQADYDMETADCLFAAGRTFYAVFMCHLSIEKALKGLYTFTFSMTPPKTHSLVFLLEQLGIKPPEALGLFLLRLNDAGVVTRYPDDIPTAQRVYSKARTREIIADSKEALEWIRTKL